MSEELKACPFCGSGTQEIRYGADTWQWVECECGASGKADLGWSGAIEHWNTRPLEDALHKQLDECESKNKSLWNATQTQQKIINRWRKQLQDVKDNLLDIYAEHKFEPQFKDVIQPIARILNNLGIVALDNGVSEIEKEGEK